MARRRRRPASPDDWLQDSGRVKEYLEALTDPRRLRLFAAAYWLAQVERIEQEEGPEHGLREAVEEAMNRADGRPYREIRSPAGYPFAVLAENAGAAAGSVAGVLHRHSPRKASAAQAHALFEDLFGGPAQPTALDPGWLTWGDGVVRKLALAVYEERAFDRLPILADALEEAGCTDAGLLAHLRRPGVHARGCWALDLVLPTPLALA
jgi:hypothetical protein